MMVGQKSQSRREDGKETGIKPGGEGVIMEEIVKTMSGPRQELRRGGGKKSGTQKGEGGEVRVKDEWVIAGRNAPQ